MILVVHLVLCVTASEALASSPWSFGIDLSYEKTDETPAGSQPAKTTKDLRQELQIRHNIALTLETKVESELRGKIEREYIKGSSSEPDTSLKEPYGRFQVQSRLYDFGMGYKKSENKTSSTLLQDEGFADLSLQPESLPEINVKYDFSREKKSVESEETDIRNISISSIYNIQDFLNIRLGYEGEKTDYLKDRWAEGKGRSDIREENYVGQVSLKHFLMNNKLRFDLDYKVEKESEKNELDPNSPGSNNPSSEWVYTGDRLIHTAITKFTYTITPDTTVSTYYEDEHTRNNKTQNNGNQGEQADIFRMDISQRMFSFVRLFGKYRSEKNKDENEDESINSYDAEIQADPRKWLNLLGKFEIESRDVDHFTDNAQDAEEDTRTIEGTWSADFPQFLDAQNAFDARLVKEKVKDTDSRREMQYRWRLHLTPISHLNLTPEYDFSEEDDYLELKDKTTREFKTVITYSLFISHQLKIDLSHSLSRKRISESQGSRNKQHNDDTKLDVRFTPFQNLIFSSQINRQDMRTIDNGDLTRDKVDTSYALNFDWRFDPFTWSGSFKYDDRDYAQESEGDTETMETRLVYRFRSYEITTNYKYTKTYSLDNNKEQRIGLQIRANFL